MGFSSMLPLKVRRAERGGFGERAEEGLGKVHSLTRIIKPIDSSVELGLKSRSEP